MRLHEKSRSLPWPVTYAAHLFLAVPVAIVAGMTPDGSFYREHYGTMYEPLRPWTALIAASLGFLLNWKLRHRTAAFVFIPALLIVAWTIRDLAKGWSPARTNFSKTQFVYYNTLGMHPHCEGDCFPGVGAEMLSSSLAYSIGATLGLLVAPKQRVRLKREP